MADNTSDKLPYRLWELAFRVSGEVLSTLGWPPFRKFVGRGGKPREEQLEIRSLNNARAARARKGRAADLGFKPSGIARVE